MRCALLGLCPHPETGGRWSGAVTRIIQALRSLPHDHGSEDGTRDAPGLPPGRNGGHRFMRRIIIAAAIASGLVALWAAILPLAA